MKLSRCFCRTAVALACLGTIVPQTVLAETFAESRAVITDLALEANGSLSGVVVDGQGIPQPGAAVMVSQEGQVVANSIADEQGRFAVNGLRGGIHQISAGEHTAVYRLWAPNTAPPTAKSQVMLVGNQNVARGNGGSGIVRFVTNPWVLAGIVATAIAVPIALNNNSHGSGS